MPTPDVPLSRASRYRLGLVGASHPTLTFEQPDYPLPDPDGWADQPPDAAQTIGLQAAAGLRLVVRPTGQHAWRDVPNGRLGRYVAAHTASSDLDGWVATATDMQIAAVWATAIDHADQQYRSAR